MTIFNNSFTNEEIRWLNFILKQDLETKDETYNFINQLSPQNIVRDYSEYYKIIEFRTEETQNGYDGMSPMICIQIIRKDGSAPTVITLYSKNDVPFEYEIYNADSSAINLDTIFDGEVVKIEEA